MKEFSFLLPTDSSAYRALQWGGRAGELTNGNVTTKTSRKDG